MPIKLTVSDTVRVKVAGTINDATGPQPFDFHIVCKRLDVETLKERLTSESETVADFLASVITNWQGVKGDQGEVPYSEASLRDLLKIPGLSGVALSAYVSDCGARAKN